MSNEIKLDLGTAKVHKHVLEDIIAKSIKDIQGVSLIKPTLTDRLLKLINKDDRPGIKITVDENQELHLDITVNVDFGTNIPDIGRKIQDIVKHDIKNALDVAIKDINVDIEGIERG